MRRQGGGAGSVGVSQAPAQGAESRRPGAAGLSDESQLFAGVHAWTDRGRVSGSGVVPFVQTGSVGAHPPQWHR